MSYIYINSNTFIATNGNTVMLGADGSALKMLPGLNQAACRAKTGSAMQNPPIGVQEWAQSKTLNTSLTFEPY